LQKSRRGWRSGRGLRCPGQRDHRANFAPWFVEQVGEEIADARDPSDSEGRREHGCVERLPRWGPHGSESTASERPDWQVLGPRRSKWADSRVKGDGPSEMDLAQVWTVRFSFSFLI
jgi:hypothetical protein